MFVVKVNSSTTDKTKSNTLYTSLQIENSFRRLRDGCQFHSVKKMSFNIKLNKNVSKFLLQTRSHEIQYNPKMPYRLTNYGLWFCNLLLLSFKHYWNKFIVFVFSGLSQSKEGSAERRDVPPVGYEVLHGVQQDSQVQSWTGKLIKHLVAFS